MSTISQFLDGNFSPKNWQIHTSGKGKRSRMQPKTVDQVDPKILAWRRYHAQIDPSETINWFTLMDWLKSSDEQQAFEVWKTDFLSRHPELAGEEDDLLHWCYGIDPAIENFWQSTSGRALKESIIFWCSVKSWLHFSSPAWARFDFRTRMLTKAVQNWIVASYPGFHFD